MRDSADLFDEYSDSYESALAAALEVSGEGREYFANGRVNWLRKCLVGLNARPSCGLDFGCGDGATGPILQKALKLERILGLDVSAKSIEAARSQWGSERIDYCTLDLFRPAGEMDVAYCNGVFHHIPQGERLASLKVVHAALRDGGLFSFWENNPWNPATHYVMSKCAFDRDVIMLFPGAAKRLLREAGFEIIRTDFLFLFPRALGMFRDLERGLSRLPLGTQYQILCRKKN
jgi:SAM-dependent methyltransferase